MLQSNCSGSNTGRRATNGRHAPGKKESDRLCSCLCPWLPWSHQPAKPNPPSGLSARSSPWPIWLSAKLGEYDGLDPFYLLRPAIIPFCPLNGSTSARRNLHSALSNHPPTATRQYLSSCLATSCSHLSSHPFPLLTSRSFASLYSSLQLPKSSLRSPSTCARWLPLLLRAPRRLALPICPTSDTRLSPSVERASPSWYAIVRGVCSAQTRLCCVCRASFFLGHVY